MSCCGEPPVTYGQHHSLGLPAHTAAEGIPGLGTAFEVYDDEDQNKLVKQCMENAGLSIEENDLRRFKGIISYAKINMIDPDAIAPRAGERFDDASAAVYRRYQASS